MGARISFPRHIARGKEQKKAEASENKKTSHNSHERKFLLRGCFNSAPSSTTLDTVIGDYPDEKDQREEKGQKQDKDENPENYQQPGNSEQQEKDRKREKGRQQGQNPANDQKPKKNQNQNNGQQQDSDQHPYLSPQSEDMEMRLASVEVRLKSVEKQGGFNGSLIASKYTFEYEQQVLEPAGISLSHQFGDATLAEHAQHFCKKLCDAHYKPPNNPLYTGRAYIHILELARRKTLAGVLQGLHQTIVPSPENLFFTGESSISYLRENYIMHWLTVDTVADGPRPSPTHAIGLKPTAFTDDELQQLKSLQSRIATKFDEDMYFPFFTCNMGTISRYCERKCAREGAAGMNAIIKLHELGEIACLNATGQSGLKQLSREALYFSITYISSYVKIFCHYPIIEEGKKTLYRRHLVRAFELNDQGFLNKWTAYNFVRALYEQFSGIHLNRIKDAIRYASMNTAKGESGSESRSLMSEDTAVDRVECASLKELAAVADPEKLES